jgi:protoheme IX farnesyltransferase
MDTIHTIASNSSDTSRLRLGDLWPLTKPRMNVVVVVTTLAGYYLAAGDSVDWMRAAVTLIGTAFTAASASVLNQVMERDVDARMPRTAARPLPAGRIRSSEACLLGLLLGGIGITVLAIDVNLLTASLGAITLFTYLFLYTPTKRYTTFCTLLGAVPGAIPVMMGCAAATSSITPTALALFLILFAWQIPHFLAIAVLYRDDYARGGLHVLPVSDASLDATARQVVLYCLALIPVTVFPVLLGIAGPGYLVIALVLNAMFTSYGIAFARSRKRQHARQLFLASLGYLLCLLPAMVVGRL